MALGFSHRYNKMKIYLLIAVLLFAVSPVKIFLFGSVLLNDNNPAYKKLI